MRKLMEWIDAYAQRRANNPAPYAARRSRAAVVAEVEKLERDAARYQWLAWRSDTNPIMPCDTEGRVYFGKECDAAIDAAMGETK